MDSLILASKSPRRRDILNKLNIPYIVYEVEIDESIGLGASARSVVSLRYARSLVIEISKRKVADASHHFSNGIVVGIDTVVCFKKRVLRKPENSGQAYEYMKLLNGRRHEVLSGITVKDIQEGLSYSSSSLTEVFFSRMTEDEINRYIELNEWVDKAGGYAIQGSASLYIKKIVGSYYNVMGLPVEELYKLLKRFYYFEYSGKYRPVRRL